MYRSELHECTDLVIAPMANTEISRKIGIPVDDRSKEKDMDKDDADDGKRHFYEDVDGELMTDVADDVDNTHDDELVTVYDKENHVIVLGERIVRAPRGGGE
jgi:hypothetical protein